MYSTLRALAKHGKHNVSEFIIDDEMRYRLGRSDGTDDKTALADLRSLVQRPGFHRLHLHNKHPIQMYKVLEKAENLQSLRFQVEDYDPSHRWNHSAVQASDGVAAQMNIYLEFPMPLSQSLQNLAIKGVRVDADSLAAALAPLASLRSLELRSVFFYHRIRDGSLVGVGCSQNARDFLYALRDKTDWRSRPLRPKVTILFSEMLRSPIQILKIDSQVNEFLYEDGENPFSPTEYCRDIMFHEMSYIIWMRSGKGFWIDKLDPEYERPNYDENILERLHREQNFSIRELRRPNSWGDGPSGPQTCPTLEEQGIDPDCGG